MKIPQFGDPIDTVLDLEKQNITIFEQWTMFKYNRDWYYTFNTSAWDYVASTMVPATLIGYHFCRGNETLCADINGTYEYHVKHLLHRTKTHAFIRHDLHYYDTEIMPEMKNWWRSEKLELGLSPFAGSITSRNWILNEVN